MIGAVQSNSMSIVERDLWALTWGQPSIDPDSLAAAIERQLEQTDDLDHRTRVLIRDSIRALEAHWGAAPTRQWIDRSPQRHIIDTIMRSDLGAAGFASLSARLMKSVDPKTVLEYLRTLGQRATQPTRIVIGGSIALILTGELSRATDDIDLVDEVPAQLRNEHEFLDQLSRRFGLRLAHFQSHYLPQGWETRVRSLGMFGQLQVTLVDSYDILLGKLFSRREKDLDDLRTVNPPVDQQRLTDRLLDSAPSFLADPQLKQNAQSNWYILFGQPLPERKQP